MPLDPSDYIDPDEGREDLRPFFTFGHVCENCGHPCDRLTFVPGFNYFGCDDCVSEASILVYAESNCPALYNRVMRSKSVGEVQTAFQAHQESCPQCLKQTRKPAKVEGLERAA